MILSYSGSYETKLLAISIKPGISFILVKSLVGISLALIMFKGKNVALPK